MENLIQDIKLEDIKNLEPVTTKISFADDDTIFTAFLTSLGDFFGNIELLFLQVALFLMPFVKTIVVYAWALYSTPVPLLCFFTGLFLLDKLGSRFVTGFSPNENKSDPTNVGFLDRGLALTGLLVPYTQLCNMIGKQTLRMYLPSLMLFNSQYLGTIKVFILQNPWSLVAFNVVAFREIIRRRGPDTIWGGYETKRFSIKYFVRYYWCVGLCFSVLEEPYTFFKQKFTELLEIPVEVYANLDFLVLGALSVTLCYHVLCILIGITSRAPLFHGACEMHVGRPKK